MKLIYLISCLLLAALTNAENFKPRETGFPADLLDYQKEKQSNATPVLTTTKLGSVKEDGDSDSKTASTDVTEGQSEPTAALPATSLPAPTSTSHGTIISPITPTASPSTPTNITTVDPPATTKPTTTTEPATTTTPATTVTPPTTPTPPATTTQVTTTSKTTVAPSPPSTTVAPNTTTTTIAPAPSPPSTTVSPNATTTAAPIIPTTPAPNKNRTFDGPSFIGGIILAVGLMAIGLVAWKFYRARTERNYHTL